MRLVQRPVSQSSLLYLAPLDWGLVAGVSNTGRCKGAMDKPAVVRNPRPAHRAGHPSAILNSLLNPRFTPQASKLQQLLLL
ncbi:MAG: hypothetical protein ACJASY_001314 [Halioglobus sp.]|jgi:hypothetical protein